MRPTRSCGCLAYVAPEPIVAPAPIVRQRRPTSYGLSEDASFAGTSHPEQTLRPRSGSARTAGPSSKSMDGAPAQGRAFEPGASESANSRASRMRRRPNQFGLPCGTMARLGRGEPCSDAAADPFGRSKLNRTAPSGKVSLLASTDTSIRLANLTFGRSARAR
jgi:hypothetical protein